MCNGRQSHYGWKRMLECMTMTNTTAVKDLVCGMDVDPATAEARSEYQGQAYYFCCTSCKEKFDRDPEQYVGQAGCCS